LNIFTTKFYLIGLTFFIPTILEAQKKILILLGSPGSGKGTLVEYCKQFNFTVLSTGNLCRQEIASKSHLGQQIEYYSMTTGLTPDNIIDEMVETWLDKQVESETIIFDGYPRTKDQAERLSNYLQTKMPDSQLDIFYLESTDDEELVQRILNRLVCENKQCQAVYNRRFTNSQSCKKCKGILIQRADDTEHIVRLRIAGFIQNNLEIIDYYNKLGIPVKRILVSNVTPEEVFERFINFIELETKSNKNSLEKNNEDL